MPLNVLQIDLFNVRQATRPGLFSFINKLAATVFFVGSSDFLLRDGGYAGWPVALSCLILLGIVVATRRDGLKDPAGLTTLFVPASLAVAQIYSPDALGLLLFWILIASFALRQQFSADRNGLITLRRIAWYALAGWLRPLLDLHPLLKSRRRTAAPTGQFAVQPLLLPVGGGITFAVLFALANPMFNRALSTLDPTRLLTEEAITHMFWWGVLGTIAWSLLRARVRGHAMPKILTSAVGRTGGHLFVTGQSLIVSLALFNVLFAAENLLDLYYLWSGADLPADFTRAEYAHRGAYTLIATALLSAALILLIFRGNDPVARHPLIRPLVYAWIGQNVFLVASSALRTMDYVDIFGLTLWRLSALIWMGLVAVGLVLICVRITRGKSSLWLINANLAAAFAVLYACAIADLGAMVANYNVRHSDSVQSSGSQLDLYYLQGLGIAALPALDWLDKMAPLHDCSAEVAELRGELIEQAERAQANWRTWTLRNQITLWRLHLSDTQTYPVSNLGNKGDRKHLVAAIPGLPSARVTPYGASGSFIIRPGKPS